MFARRPFTLHSPWPLISFTFDDFPQSALQAGGAILKERGLAGTYYVSLGLLGKDGPTGRIAVADDLTRLVEQGHELGCHTFAHCDSWETPTQAFESSVRENRAALKQLFPSADFSTFSYPISPPRPRTKARMAAHFACCRGGGQTLNHGTVDLNYLAAYFLEKSRDQIQAVKDLIDRNREVRGWLILATHDIADQPTPFGCRGDFFQDVVRYAVSSGARILPVAKALKTLRPIQSMN